MILESEVFNFDLLEKKYERPDYRRIASRMVDFLLNEESKAIFKQYHINTLYNRDPEETLLYKAISLVNHRVLIPKVFDEDGVEIAGISTYPKYGELNHSLQNLAEDLAEFVWYQSFHELEIDFMTAARKSMIAMKKTLLWDVICCIPEDTRLIRLPDFYHWYYQDENNHHTGMFFSERKVLEFLLNKGL